MGDFRPYCVKCGKRMHCEENDVVVRYSENEIQRGDKWKCSECEVEIIFGFGEPHESRMHCDVCNKIFSSVSLYYGHIDEIESGDRCRECHITLVHDNYNGHYEGRPSGDTEVGEFIVTGYKCICGYEEEW